MAHAAAFDDVRRAVADFGPRATIITVAESLRPHVVTAVVGVDGESLLIDVGAGTRANLVAHPDLALVWTPPGNGEYELILDGTAEHIGEPDGRSVSTVRIAVAGGILHRLAGLPDGAPSCRSLSEFAAS
jgi:hypothetical protein